MVFRVLVLLLPASLENFAALHAKVGRWYFQNFHDMVTNVYPDDAVALLQRQGVFYYDYVHSLVRLDEPAVPPRKAFFNKLKGVKCSQADYAHAQHVWDNFH